MIPRHTAVQGASRSQAGSGQDSPAGIQGCQVDLTPNKLIFCSDCDYWEGLEAVGSDIIGLSGNHVNDFGLEGPAETLAFYRDRGINTYGGGDNLELACVPLAL